MRFSLLTGIFALAAVVFFAYQVQTAGALVAVEPASEPPVSAPTPAEEKTATEAPAKTNAVTAAEAAKYGVFTCTPENFTLTASADGYHLHGTLDTPTPGYGYTPVRINETPDAADMVIELRAPQGMVMEVIGKLEISHMYVRDAAMQTLTVRLDKAFNWDPDTIVCQNIAAASQSDTHPEAPAPTE